MCKLQNARHRNYKKIFRRKWDSNPRTQMSPSSPPSSFALPSNARALPSNARVAAVVAVRVWCLRPLGHPDFVVRAGVNNKLVFIIEKVYKLVNKNIHLAVIWVPAIYWFLLIPAKLLFEAGSGFKAKNSTHSNGKYPGFRPGSGTWVNSLI